MSVDGPLKGVLVLDFSQFLAGPVAAVRLADLGARVIKIERPGVGELGRTLVFAGAFEDGDTLNFQAMNRNKEGITANLKDPTDLGAVRKLIRHADVLIQNFRPGVMERIGLDYDSVRAINPRIIYGSVSGYGHKGPWSDRPGQDLLAQSLSGVPWLTGSRDDPPIPIGVSVADLVASIHLAQGITALLYRRERTGEGGLIETSLIEGMFDLQFELLSTYFSKPGLEVARGGVRSANGFLPAPYGIYPTSDGYLALAMNPVDRIGRLIGDQWLASLTESQSWSDDADAIADALTAVLRRETLEHWLSILDPADVWCAPVMTLDELADSDGFEALDMMQEVSRIGLDGSLSTMTTTRSPIRIDGRTLAASAPAPRVGEHNDKVRIEFGI